MKQQRNQKNEYINEVIQNLLISLQYVLQRKLIHVPHMNIVIKYQYFKNNK